MRDKRLSKRERERLAKELRMRGQSTRQIAEELDVGRGTAARAIAGVPIGTPEHQESTGDKIPGEDNRYPPFVRRPRPAGYLVGCLLGDDETQSGFLEPLHGA